MTRIPIILASGSPRRSELLHEAGVSFEASVAQVRELDSVSSPDLSPTELALANAGLKAEAVAGKNPSTWVLGADTVVALGKRVFGKPTTLEQAREFLLALSGRTHEVVTGCVLIGPDGEKESVHEVSRVTFFELSDELIERYVYSVEVMDKAGAYALQERGEWIVESVEGSRTNVIGLPMEKLGELLRKHGLGRG